jgi:type II secretory pathway component GspD/PulD (secretin)
VGRFPQISTRETQSSISVKSGQTIVIGGLIQEQDIKKWQEVPVLSRIPFFGELFKWRSTSKTSSQVVISITPTVVRPEDNQPE